MKRKNLLSGAFLLLLPFTTLSAGAATVVLHGYGVADPARFQSPLLSTEASQRAALLDLQRQYLYVNGCEIQKTANGYSIGDKGRTRDLEPEYRGLSPLFSQAESPFEIPEALSQRVMQVIQVNLSYTGALDVKSFESAKAYLNWVDDSLVKALGDELVKKGWLKNGAACALEYLHFERALGKKKISAKISYVAKR
jgi:hypothetical protein